MVTPIRNCGLFHYPYLSVFYENHNSFFHSHKKGKDSLKGSLVRVLFAAKPEFPEILVPMLPKHTSDVNIGSTGKSKQPYYLSDQLLGALIYLHFIVLILIYFSLIMHGVNHGLNGCSSSRTSPGV